jgi:hypothetical protein
MTAQERYRKAIGIVRAIEIEFTAGKDDAALPTDKMLDFADAIVALTGRQRVEPKSGTRKPKAGKPNGAEQPTA